VENRKESMPSRRIEDVSLFNREEIHT
jgi:hypothetical protein